jgi:CheY-like chemotaxis protein
MNVLVADDDLGCICLLQEVLSSIPDVSVITASDGAEAWWWLTHPEMRYALAIIDVKMPKVDGFALASRMRQTPHLLSLPLVMCTGLTDRRFVTKAASLKISCYLVKPFSPETLISKVESLLPHRSGRTFTIADESDVPFSKAPFTNGAVPKNDEADGKK